MRVCGSQIANVGPVERGGGFKQSDCYILKGSDLEEVVDHFVADNAQLSPLRQELVLCMRVCMRGYVRGHNNNAKNMPM